jgi:hypothetical protein
MNDSTNARQRAALDAWTAVEPPAGFAGRVLAVRDAHRRMRWIAAAGAVTAAAAVVAVVWVPAPREAQAVAPVVTAPQPPVVDAGTGDDVDLEVTAGESFTIHEPSERTLVRFDPPRGSNMGDRCSVELSPERDMCQACDRVRMHEPTTLLKIGRDTVFIEAGIWQYRMSCSVPPDKTQRPGGEAEAEGVITALHDDGHSPTPLMPHQMPHSIVIEKPEVGAPWSKSRMSAFGFMPLGWQSREHGDWLCMSEAGRCSFHGDWEGPGTHHVLTFDAPDGRRHYFLLRAPGTRTR